MTQKKRMLAGLPYKGWLDGLEEERIECSKKIYAFNLLPPDIISPYLMSVKSR